MTDWSRRGFLSGLLASVGTGAVVSSQAALGLDDPQIPTNPAGAPRAAKGPEGALPEGATHALHEVVPPGTRFGRWRVVAIHPVTKGAVPVVLADALGQQFQVDVLRREPAGVGGRAIATTRHYALHLANGARGNTATPEDRGLAVMWLAALMRPREFRVAPVALLTLRQRIQGFPRGRFDAMRGGVDRPTPSTATAVAAARLDSEQNPRWRLDAPRVLAELPAVTPRSDKT